MNVFHLVFATILLLLSYCPLITPLSSPLLIIIIVRILYVFCSILSYFDHAIAVHLDVFHFVFTSLSNHCWLLYEYYMHFVSYHTLITTLMYRHTSTVFIPFPPLIIVIVRILVFRSVSIIIRLLSSYEYCVRFVLIIDIIQIFYSFRITLTSITNHSNILCRLNVIFVPLPPLIIDIVTNILCVFCSVSLIISDYVNYIHFVCSDPAAFVCFVCFMAWHESDPIFVPFREHSVRSDPMLLTFWYSFCFLSWILIS